LSQAIDLDIELVKGRYVKIQLLGKNFLSLAEVKVWGSDLPTPPIIEGDTDVEWKDWLNEFFLKSKPFLPRNI